MTSSSRVPYTDSSMVSLLLAQEAASPEGWELIGRIVVVLGVAGIFGLASRQVGIWLRKRYKRRPR
jgi:hypothetical protein